MKRMFMKFSQSCNSKKGTMVSLAAWLIVVLLLSALAPSAKDFAANSSGSGLPEDAASVVADKELKEHFEGSEAMPAIFVFHSNSPFDTDALSNVGSGIAALNQLPAKERQGIKQIIPFEQMNVNMQKAFLSEDETTLVLPVHLQDELEMDNVNELVNSMEETVQVNLPEEIELSITGPAGIASDALELFSRGDLVLLFSTIGLIFVLLIIIYRSPLLAFIPLIAAGIVYEVVNRVIGLAGKNDWFVIESQSLSIMMILLFAAITDYSLFVFSRFREELQVVDSKYEAMQRAMSRVGEPIFFSGGTVLVAVLTLAVAIYEPYQSFAPVFSVAMLFILAAGLTLVPALFTLFGRKSFWPAVPRTGAGKEVKTNKWWEKVSHVVTSKPLVTGMSVLILLVLLSLNALQIKYSYNLIQSFPEDMTSRAGFEILEEKFTPGEVAPTTVLVTSEQKIDEHSLAALITQLEQQELVSDVSVNEQGIAENGQAAQLSLIFSANPYTEEALDALANLRAQEEKLLSGSGLNAEQFTLQFAGETAKNVDIRGANDRDTILVMALVTVLITIMLGLQSRSIIAPIYMMLTILLSYSAALGLADLIFRNVFDYEQMSYRIPLYSFVFLVALGVDYNIMLVSRIQEYVREHSFKKAVRQGLARSGGVISSAGLILAATFAVLITQPILELFMFGFVVTLGVLIDTFLVRTILTPAIIMKLGRWSFWPHRNS